MDESFQSDRRTHWVSQPFADLIVQLGQHEIIYDVVIIGSGYGGSIAAAELAGCTDQDGKPVRVCVLERGEEYLPGSFPKRLSELPGHVRFSPFRQGKPGGKRKGLFDFRLGNGVNSLIANGLGGGSLINAGVMEIPDDDLFSKGWPAVFSNKDELTPYYHEAKKLLGASVDETTDNTIERHPRHQQHPLSKFESLKQLSRESFRPAAITVAMQDDDITSAGVELNACTLCGDCATGCNHGAKNSLDINLLKQAKDAGAEIYTGVTVLSFNQQQNLWHIKANYTEEKLATRQGSAITIKAHHLILAAGTMGSSELMLRSEKLAELKFSRQLGNRFSSNGDMIAVGYAQSQQVNAVADETTDYLDRKIGPTITGVIDTTTTNSRHKIIIEEMAVPGPIQRIFSELYTTLNCIHELERGDFSFHHSDHSDQDPFAVHTDNITHTSIYAVIGRDDANGKLRLNAEHINNQSDGHLIAEWPDLNQHPLFKEQISTLEKLSKENDIGGRILPNPAWKLLPDDLNDVMDGESGPLLTVHPLGGCPMGDDIHLGVVNDKGQVYKVDNENTTSVYENLAVLDGAIIPTAIGTNPALTIAAVSLRAVRQLKKEWNYSQIKISEPCITQRPIYWQVKKPDQPVPTQIELIERTSALVPLKDKLGNISTYRVELTLQFDPKNISDIASTAQKSNLNDPFLFAASSNASSSHSFIRILDDREYQNLLGQKQTFEELEQALDDSAVFKAPLHGCLRIAQRGCSFPSLRVIRSGWAWFFNRGRRDFAQRKKNSSKGWVSWAMSLVRLASRAGEKRLFQYELNIGMIADSNNRFAHICDGTIKGVKTISYNRRCNPWKQLMQMKLIEFPSWPDRYSKPTFELDLRFLGRIKIPLIQVVEHENEVNSLFDLFSFLSYFMRLLIHIHLWSFRKPESARDRKIDRLPGTVPGMPSPEIIELPVNQENKKSFPLRITHYCRNADLLAHEQRSAVVMLHGYSASGTTYAHPALRPGLAKYLWDLGHDIWIVDFRSSCGLPSAQEPWTFEDIAYHDIPLAFKYIYEHNEKNRFDVVAHCMGSAMFSMAVLKNVIVEIETQASIQSAPIKELVSRVVLSQVGPHVVFTPINVFRSYVSSYLRHYLPFKKYRFRSINKSSASSQLLDRLLYSLPYPDEEFDLEHPFFNAKKPVEFVATRRRMDALYGRAFNLKDLNPEVLDHIDDFFGPLNMNTVAQVIHFAQLRTITDRNGRNRFTTPDKVSALWDFPTLSIHGKQNGLADILTTDRMHALMDSLDRDYQIEVAECGHQDSLIGAGPETQKLFRKIGTFLEAVPDQITKTKILLRDTPSFRVEIPWAGPVLGPRDHEIRLPDSDKSTDINQNNLIHVMAGGNPLHGHPQFVCFVAVKKNGEHYLPMTQDERALHEIAKDKEPIPDNVLFIVPNQNDESDWAKNKIPLELMQPTAAGVLELMVYNQSEDNSILFSLNEPFRKSKNYLQRWLQHDHNSVAISCLLKAIDDYLTNTPIHDLEQGLLVLPTEHQITDSITFAAGSCQYPAGILYPSIGTRSYQRLAQQMDQKNIKPDFLLLMGDQVYVDATAGIFDPSNNNDKYTPQYLNHYHRKAVRSVMRRLSTFTILDDHEIDNDWEPVHGEEYKIDEIKKGKQHYLKFQRHIHPTVESNDSLKDIPLWYSFNRAGLDFFIIDSRTERDPRTAKKIRNTNIIDHQQLSELKNWLLKNRDKSTPKFIASASLPFPRHIHASNLNQKHHAVYSDGWDGYPDTLTDLLLFIFQEKIHNIIFLSGDEHLSCDAKMILSDLSGNNPLEIRSIHCSPLHAPFPFANATEEEFIHHEKFTLQNKNQTCMASISSQWISGQGFAFLNVRKQDHRWNVTVKFDRV